MAAYTTVYTYRPIAHVEVELTSPLSGRVEPLELTLYAYKVESMLYWAVRNRPLLPIESRVRVRRSPQLIGLMRWRLSIRNVQPPTPQYLTLVRI